MLLDVIGTLGAAMIASEPPKKGGILAALRRSWLVGTDLNLTRSQWNRVHY